MPILIESHANIKLTLKKTPSLISRNSKGLKNYQGDHRSASKFEADQKTSKASLIGMFYLPSRPTSLKSDSTF